jgi:short-subunit dehydrogenase
MSMLLSHYRRIWVIGASSGIGEALVKALDHPDRTVIVSARNKAALESLALASSGPCLALPMDINQAEDVEAVCHALADQSPVDMVILNAGTCEYMDSTRLDLALLERVMQTNFFSIVRLIDQALPMMRRALGQGVKRPKLVVMSSSVTYQALPRAHAYGASKSALRYFTECLKADVQKEGIDVRIVSPGFVKTPLTDQNDFEMPFRVSAQDAAYEIIKGLEGERFDISFPKKFTLYLKAVARLPDAWRFKILGKMSRHALTDVPETTHKSQDRSV